MNDFSEKMINYYQLLDIAPKASGSKVKEAYLQKMKRWHPDKNPDRTSEAEEKTKVLNQAYEILSDDEKRKNYDRMLRFTRGRNFGDHINDEAMRSKLSKAYPSLKKVFENVRELYALFKDSVKGNYKLHTANVAIIGGGLLYFILPTDLIPDFIPFIGYLDDLAVLTTIMTTLKGEIDAYRAWRETHPEAKSK